MINTTVDELYREVMRSVIVEMYMRNPSKAVKLVDLTNWGVCLCTTAVTVQHSPK